MILEPETILRVKRTGHHVLHVKNRIELRRSFVVLVGPNGGGKTAMLKAVCGFGPFEVFPHVEPPRRFLYLDHEPLVGVESWMPAIDVARLYLRESEHQIRHWLGRLSDVDSGLRETVLRRAPIAEMSTGQRQALMMLCAQRLNTPLCAFDESFSALDPMQFNLALGRVGDISGQLRDSDGVVIIATHDYEVMQRCVAVAQTSGLPIRYVSVRGGIAKELKDIPRSPLTRDDFNTMYDGSQI